MSKLVRITCVILAVLMSLNTLFFNNGLKAVTVKTGYIFETNVNVRKEATTTSESIAKVSNLYVTVLGSKEDIKSVKNPSTNKVFIWYEISYNSSSGTVKGYIREDLITVTESTVNESFEKQLAAFPESYREALSMLHKKYPNWQFVADKVSTKFLEAVSAQDYLFYKLTQSGYNSWRSMRKGCYDWSDNSFVKTDNGTWYGASREVIAYYMDPRNFLNENDIYIFMKQSFDSASQTIDGVEALVKGTFLDNKISDSNDQNNGKRYAYVICQAAQSSNVNAYVIASTILQEQGVNGTILSKGTAFKDKKVYNFFNFGASGSDKNEVLYNAKSYAYNQGWFSVTESIIGGATKFGKEYIAKGQDTYFYKNYNVLQPENLWHQYAQNVADSLNTSKFLKNAYIDRLDMNLTFRIPVYQSLPNSVSKLPDKNSKLNNYYFSDISASGLTPSFNRYVYEYSLSADENITVTAEVPNGASIISDDTFNLKKGENVVKLIVKSQTGYTNTYIINVDAQKNCTLKILNSDSGTVPPPQEVAVKKGDTNDDGKITTSDLANVRLHLLELIKLKDDNSKGADTNGDGKITTTDLANIRLHLLEIITLK